MGYIIKNGTLFINAGEPYLEHHGVLGMKWGKHLRAGKGPVDGEAGAGGGAGEDDEKLKEMAKKAGMSVAEYKQKFASKIGGAASKVGSAVYDAAGGSHKKNAEGWRKMAQEESNAARASERSSHENSARAASQDRKYGSGGDVYRRAADSDKENAKTHHSNAKARSERAASEQAAYEKSLAGKYDKMKADQARKKSAKEKKRLLTQTNGEAKRISVKDKHLIINGNRSSGTRSLAVGETGEKPKSFKERAYNAAGGRHKTKAENFRKEANKALAEEQALTAKAHRDRARAASGKRKAKKFLDSGNKEDHDIRLHNAKFVERRAKKLEKEAKQASKRREKFQKKANKEQSKYERSLAGKYDKKKSAKEKKRLQTQTSSEGKRVSVRDRHLVVNGNSSAKKRVPSTILSPKHTDTSHRRKSVGEVMNNAKNPTPGDTPIPSLTQYTHTNRPRGREKYFKLGQESKGVKKRSKRVRHFDGSDELYTEGTRLVINSKWG